MDNVLANVCTRCGKPRIVSKTWTEKVTTAYRTSVLKHTETVCPDPKCQKKVNDELAALRQKRLEIQQSRDKREEDRKTHKVDIKL